MIVVAIIAILASIAIPSYQDHIRRGQLQEAFALLSGFQLQMEQSYQDNRNYGIGRNCQRDAPTSNRFTFECELSAQGQAYTLTGTGNTNVLQGYAYTINEQGQRRTTLFKNQASQAACWLDKNPSC